MAQQLKVIRDISGIPVGGIPFPQGNSYNTTLAPNVVQTLVVPSGYNLALFSFTPQGVFVAQGNVDASLPGGIFIQTNDELNPTVRQVTPGQTLSFISSVDAYVQVRFVQNNANPS